MKPLHEPGYRDVLGICDLIELKQLATNRQCYYNVSEAI